MRLEKSSYDEIANELKRTSRSIQTRLYQNVCKSVETDNDDEASLIQKYDIDYEDFLSFKTQRQEKLNKYESRKEAGSGGGSGEGRSGASDGFKTYRKPRRYDTGDRSDTKSQYAAYASSSQYTTPYENKNYNMRNELSTLRQEVYELRRIVNEMRA
jgi:hypothetical protein